jgi:ATP-dependent helicase HrpB
MIDDPKLRGVSVLIFDEFHERHLYGDITLARALDLQEQHRPDLNLIVMSATLDAELLGNYMSSRRGELHEPPTLLSETGRRVTPPSEFGCSILSSEGCVFPVENEYAAQPGYTDKRPVWEQAAEAFSHYVGSGGEGDVLVFMPGGYEISQTIEAIRHTSESKGFILLPLHGELSPKDQDAAVARYGQRKVVVSTNVAETSLTIDGIRLVIDSGLARIPRYDPYRGINTLLIEKISQSSADQRTGRAGRTAPGVCMRLWSREEHGHRLVQELPEIKRLDLAEVVLTLKAAGVEDLRKFRWLESPNEQSLVHAEELLLDLGALHIMAQVSPPVNETHIGRISEHRPEVCATQITPIGRKMLAFPLHPRYSRMLLAAHEYGCVHQACLVAALTQGRDLLLRNVDRDTNSLREDLLGEKASSDFWILMRAWTYAAQNQFRLDACRRLGIHAVTARQVGPLLGQFIRIAKAEGLDVKPREVKDEALQKCILIGFSDRVARRLDQGTLRCEMVHNRRGVLARESVVSRYLDSSSSRRESALTSGGKNEPAYAGCYGLFVAAEVREVEGREVNTILSLATAIEVDWLRELYPEDLESSLHVQFDSTAKRVQAAELVKFRGLALSAKRVEPPPADMAARLLADEIIAGRLPLPNWDHGVEQWLLRLRLLCQHCPELQLPPITEDDRRHIIGQLCHGAVSYKDIKEREVKPVVMSWLSEPQRGLLDKHAPERLTLANGRTPKVAYEATGTPYISLRIQELYDVTQTPKIALGRVPVLVHILTPGMKPIQITQDLASFWREHYPRIKSELQRKYPKHLWR